jgi:uncharacterized protein (TIGR03086 family)
MDLDDLHRMSVQHWLDRLVRVSGAQWEAVTPCPDWDARALVNHVVGEELWTVPLVDGATIAEVGDRFDGDLLGDDPVAVGRTAAAAAVDAVSRRLPGQGIVHLSFGDVPIGEYVHQLAADHLIHAWDLAVASSQDRRLPPEAVDGVAAWFADREDLYRHAGAIGVAGPPGDDAQSRLLASFGRDPAWSA